VLDILYNLNMNKTNHRALDIELQRQRYGENSDLLKELGYKTDVMNIRHMSKDLATQDTWRYMEHHDLEDLKDCVTDYDLYEWVTNTQLDSALLANGLVLEFGTATGRTLNQFAHWLPNKTIYGFDSWQGLPEQFNDLPAGHFAQALPEVFNNCQLVPGWFGGRPTWDHSGIAEFTAQKFAIENTAPIALLHLDADLYEPTKTVLDVFAKQIVSGTVILFNEYWNHPTWKKHEFRAWQEHVAQYYVRYEYIGYASDHQEVAVRVL
jgi:hypothetical protein